MLSEYLIYALLAYILVREVIYQVTVHRLMNKLMSRNYYDYAFTEKMVDSKQEVTKPKENPEVLEDDLSYIGI